ncbi:hypothetical protein K466DRAFT_496871 [Polyporus arcularius HHB13444]|uniref:Uncharacterized protein n=1 Tax=Polyporus arcularius HHB13444 TaxID=1314778 RepID=A0A5C3P5J9_9APHY|nr:hypothetical protein K466DRAFT_496871 [Polyporus arcularius HHB13444]
MYLYNERDVERRAWERHGGPEAFDAYLAKLRERHIKKNGKSAYFAQPASYEDPKDSVQYDHTIGSAALRRAKEEMAPWLWKAYNDALDRHKNDGWYGPEYYYSRPRDREGLIASALKLAKTYPPRPAQPLPSSPSVDALRAVLADAPRIADVEWGKEVPGLAFSTTWHPEYDEWYSWTSEILQPIFEALIGVIEAHGVGDDGWASARWEVYDRYAECLQVPISYDNYDKRWSDGASGWLEGRLSPELVNGSSRGSCEAGKRYNDMLPFSHPLGLFSVGRPQS